MRDITFMGGDTDIFPVLNFSRQSPLVILVKVGWKEGMFYIRE
jgi:hypothetical protein